MIHDVWKAYRPIIFIGWGLAALRLIWEFVAAGQNPPLDDDHATMTLGVYFPVAAMLALAGLRGLLDHMVWKRMLLGCLMLGVLVWFVPNAIAYSVGQVQNWQFGRHFSDPEFLAKVEEGRQAKLSEEAAKEAAEAALGRKDQKRTAPRADTLSGQIMTGTVVGLATGGAGTVWCLVWSTIFIGIPAARRRPRR